MIVVADATPLIALLDTGRIGLLQSLYREVLIPPAVRDESFSLPGRTLPAWFRVQSPRLPIPGNVLEARLGQGETEAIALALDVRAELLLVDDRQARGVARRMGLSTAGTVSVLIRAKETGLISTLKPLLDGLVGTGFRISETLYRDALARVGESL